MSNLTDFFPSGGGGGLKPKFQEFTSSGTFTPSQALIDAGGYIEVFLVGGGASSGINYYGGSGGEVISFLDKLTSISNVSITIAAQSAVNSSGNSSSWQGSSSGGKDVTASGGESGGRSNGKSSPGWGGTSFSNQNSSSAGNGIMGYGAGGSASHSGWRTQGINTPKSNSGQGANNGIAGGSGYCLIKWYE